jgi:Flp pilus assembly protein CpaB
MRRSPRVLLAWAAAVLVVLITVRVVAGDLGALHRRAHSLGSDVPVVLAAHDLPTGSTIGVGDLRVVRRPSTTVSADALHDPAAATGKVVAVALLRDDVMGARHLAARAGGIVPEGRRAVHVVVKDGFQPPVGSVVDVLATYDPSLENVGGTSGQAATVARGAQVVMVGGTPSATDSSVDASAGAVDSNGAGVTLLVTEAEARTVAFADSIGEIALALAPVQAACCGADQSPPG